MASFLMAFEVAGLSVRLDVGVLIDPTLEIWLCWIGRRRRTCRGVVRPRHDLRWIGLDFEVMCG